MANYDDLSVKIVVDTKTAKSNVGDLTSSLTKLNEKAKELDKNQIEEVRKILFDISKIDFSNVARGLDSVVKAFKQLNTTTAKVRSKSGKELTGEMRPNVNPIDTSAFKLPDFLPFDKNGFADSLPTEGFFEKWTNETRTMAESLRELGQSFKPAIEGATQFAGQAQVVEKETLKANNTFKGFIFSVEKSVVPLKKLATQFARIVRYRIIRKIIQEIYKALQEGTQRIARFDEATNQALSNIKTSLSYLASSIGVALMPIIKSLEPILVGIIDLVAELIMAIGNLFNAMRGEALIRATKQWEDFANALKKTTTIGIDELNIIGEQEKTYYIKVEGADAVEETLKNVEKLGVAIALIGTLSSVWTALKSGILMINIAFTKLQATLSVGVLGGLIMVVSSIMDIVENGTNAQNVLMTVLGTLTVAISGFFLMLNTKIGSAIIAIGGLRTALLSCGIAMGVLVGGAMLFATLFQKVKEGWGNMNFWQKLASVLGLVLVAIGTLVATISAFTQQWHIFAIAVGGIAVGTALSVGAYKTAGDTPSFANGGFPEDGLFFANHGELVGQFSNGKTAVANNEEITAGIYEAVRDALRDSGSQGNITIEMDGYQVARGVTKRQNNMDNIIKGGNLVYGK